MFRTSVCVCGLFLLILRSVVLQLRSRRQGLRTSHGARQLQPDGGVQLGEKDLQRSGTWIPPISLLRFGFMTSKQQITAAVGCASWIRRGCVEHPRPRRDKLRRGGASISPGGRFKHHMHDQQKKLWSRTLVIDVYPESLYAVSQLVSTRKRRPLSVASLYNSSFHPSFSRLCVFAHEAVVGDSP